MLQSKATPIDAGTESAGTFNLEQHQLTVGEIHHNLPPSSLYEHAIRHEKDSSKYAELLAARMKQHRSRVWLVNTGWGGGAYGTGKRISLKHTRAIIDAIHAGALANATTARDPIFGFEVPTDCAGVPRDILWPRGVWPDASAYDTTAKKLADLFRDNFRKYESGVSAEIKSAGPA